MDDSTSFDAVGTGFLVVGDDSYAYGADPDGRFAAGTAYYVDLARPGHGPVITRHKCSEEAYVAAQEFRADRTPVDVAIRLSSNKRPALIVGIVRAGTLAPSIFDALEEVA